MAVIESAWTKYPGYRIDLVPCRGTARAWHADLLVAESTSALRVIETDHVERLYFPEADVRTELMTTTDRDPFAEVAGLEGFLGVYHEKLRVEVETSWPDDRRAVATYRFPAWGDQ